MLVTTHNHLVKLPRHGQYLDIRSWNARSIGNKTVFVCDYVIEHDVDILFLQETWLDEYDTTKIGEFTPPGYNFINVPRSIRGGGGVGALFKSTLNLTVTPTTCNLKIIEHMCITDSDSGLTFICVYRPKPSKVNKYPISDFLQEFDNLMDEVSFMPNKLIIVGDFNVHVNKPELPDVRHFHDTISINGFQQHITVPTHISGNTLDLLISRPEDNIVVTHSVKESLISDHFFIEFILAYNKPPPKKVTKTKRDFLGFYPTSFTQDLKCQLSEIPDSLSSADELVNHFSVVCTKLLDHHAPLKTRSLSIRTRLPWFNEGIACARRVRRRLERKWRKSQSEHDRTCYLDQLHLVNDMITSAKTEFFKTKIANGDDKDLFRTINTLLNNSNKQLPVFSSSDIMSEQFSNFFKSKTDKIRYAQL
ncbi:uncharacterized protein [Amphiura filiformis]|uniref:uncharacterized protein n=1 Tax=Amphiura filiformis TaxID=82378 RepID=UPI003B20FA8C